MGGVIAEQPCVPIQQVDIDVLLGEGAAHACVQTYVHSHTCA